MPTIPTIPTQDDSGSSEASAASDDRVCVLRANTADLARSLRGSTVEPKVKFVVELMVAGNFDAAVQLELSEAWDLSVSRISQLTSEAGRQIRASAGADLQDMIAQRVASLDATKRIALGLTRTYVAGENIETVPAPDVRAAIEVDKIVMTMLGAFKLAEPPPIAMLPAAPNPERARILALPRGNPERRAWMAATMAAVLAEEDLAAAEAERAGGAVRPAGGDGGGGDGKR